MTTRRKPARKTPTEAGPRHLAAEWGKLGAPFSVRDVHKLVEHTGLPAPTEKVPALHDGLNRLFNGRYSWKLFDLEQRHRRDQKKRLSDMAKKAGELLELWDEHIQPDRTPDFVLPDRAFPPRQQGVFRRMLNNLASLDPDGIMAHSGLPKRPPHRTEDEAQNHLFTQLARIYFETFGPDAGRMTTSSEVYVIQGANWTEEVDVTLDPSGPLLQFVEGCFSHVRRKAGDDLGNLLDLPNNAANFIRSRLKKLPKK